MKAYCVVVCAVLAGCVGVSPSEQADQAGLPVPPLPPVAHAALPAEAAVVSTFDQATKRETSVVLSPSITPEQVEQIRRADRHARAALTALGKHRHKPAPASLAHAKSAVDGLDAALRAP